MRAIYTIHTRETARACRATTSTRIPWALAALLVAACSGGSDDNANPADAAVAADAPPNTLTEAEQAAGWQLLFDGETTTAWRGYNQEAFPDTGWAVVDGALVVGATATDPDVAIGGDIVTTESFTDFDLKFEFMLSEVANSGVLYRVIKEEGAAIWHNAPEYQVLDDPAYIERGTMDMNTHHAGTCRGRPGHDMAERDADGGTSTTRRSVRPKARSRSRSMTAAGSRCAGAICGWWIWGDEAIVSD